MGRGIRGLVVLSGFYSLVGLVSAHELGQSRFTTPLPLPLLFLGAGGTVALTAGWLGITNHVTTDESPHFIGSLSPTIATALRVFGRIGFFLLFSTALVHGFVGRQVAAENLATVFVWPIWLKGIGLLAILFGSPWQTLSPWETLYDLLVALEGEELAVMGRPPAWLGSWLAAAGFVVGVGIVENLTTIIRSPRMTVLLVASYTVVMIVGAVLFGREWFELSDALTVLYRLYGRVAPIHFDQTDAGGYRIQLRSPWMGCTVPVGDVSLVVFVIATVYTVSFDGFTNTPEFQTVLFKTRDLLNAGPAVSVLVYLGGLAAFVASYGLAVVAVETLASGNRYGWIGTVKIGENSFSKRFSICLTILSRSSRAK